MNFNYDKAKNREDGEGHWTTYSDLFMVLSLVFLLLYVVAGSRMGTMNLEKMANKNKVSKKVKKLREENVILKKELNSLKMVSVEHVSNYANQDEKKEYNFLFKNLKNISNIQKSKKDEIIKDIDELNYELVKHIKTERNLVDYQKIVKNMINKNMILKNNVITQKNDLNRLKYQRIVDKTQTKYLIDQEKLEQEKLKTSVEDEKKLQEQIKVKFSEQAKKMEEAHIVKMNKLKEEENSQKSKLLKEINSLKMVGAQLKNEKQKLQMKEDRLQKLAESLKREKNLKEEIIISQEEKIKNVEDHYVTKISKVRGIGTTQIKRLEEEISNLKGTESELNTEKLNLLNKENNFKRKIASLGQEVNSKEQALSQMKSDMDQKIKGFEKKLKESGSSSKERKDLARKIQSEFNANNISSTVDKASGDVIIDFGLEYFETDQWYLKKGMRKKLRKLFPIYAKTLMSHSKNVASVEITGYSSPTYKSKIIDPNSFEAENRAAINYNLDLSYKRAKVIFNFLFNTDKIKYSHQKSIFPLVKVTGRSFFSEKLTDNGVTVEDKLKMKTDEYCPKYNCFKSQKVVIKYYLNN